MRDGQGSRRIAARFARYRLRLLGSRLTIDCDSDTASPGSNPSFSSQVFLKQIQKLRKRQGISRDA